MLTIDQKHEWEGADWQCAWDGSMERGVVSMYLLYARGADRE